MASARAAHEPPPNPDAALPDFTLDLASFERDDEARAACLHSLATLAAPGWLRNQEAVAVAQTASYCGEAAAAACSHVSAFQIAIGELDASCHAQVLLVACGAPDLPACLALGALAEQRAPELSRRLYDDACKQGSALACALSSSIAPMGARSPQLGLPTAACEVPNASVCRRVAESALAASPRRYRLRGEALLEAACRGGDTEACLGRALRELGARERAGAPFDATPLDLACKSHGSYCAGRGAASFEADRFPPVELDLDTAKLVLTSACRAGRAREACALAGLTQEISASAATEPAGPLYRIGCELGDVASCALEASSEPPSPERAARLAKACAAGDRSPCVGFARLAMAPTTPTTRLHPATVLGAQPGRLEALLRAACDRASAEGCAWLADPELGLVSLEETARLLPRACSGKDRSRRGCELRARWAAERGDREAGRWLGYACELGSAESCFERATSLEGRRGSEKLRLEALDAACRFGSAPGCFALADAVERTDAARAEDLRARGRELEL